MIKHFGKWLAIAAAFFIGFSSLAHAKPKEYTVFRDGSIILGGMRVSCGQVRTIVDYRVPNPGMAVPGRGIIKVNPRYLRRMPPKVRVFVFYHECGHNVVGYSELRADCYGIRRAAKEGWVTPTVLKQIGHSFGYGPRTSTHPSGKHRRANLYRCYKAAVGG